MSQTNCERSEEALFNVFSAQSRGLVRCNRHCWHCIRSLRLPPEGVSANWHGGIVLAEDLSRIGCGAEWGLSGILWFLVSR
jgi:hypothetical protein